MVSGILSIKKGYYYAVLSWVDANGNRHRKWVSTGLAQKGNKRREMSPEHRSKIVETLSQFKPSDICKIYDREYFYYNKQSIILTEVDDEGRFLSEPIEVKKPHSIILGDEEITNVNGLQPDEADDLMDAINDAKAAGEDFRVVNQEGTALYFYDEDRHSVGMEDDKDFTYLGEGTMSIGFATSKKLKSLKVTFAPKTYKDYEIIPHHFDEEENAAEVNAFLQKYVFKPYVLSDNVVGVELNFNKEFYVPEQLENAEDILKEIDELNSQIKEITL